MRRENKSDIKRKGVIKIAQKRGCSEEKRLLSDKIL